MTPSVATEPAKDWVDDLTVHHVAGGHWTVRERPEVIARLVEQFVTSSGPTVRPSSLGRFAGRLVVVTGGARGIGPATALEFARPGADVLIVDINDAGAKDTLGELRELGGQAMV